MKAIPNSLRLSTAPAAQKLCCRRLPQFYPLQPQAACLPLQANTPSFASSTTAWGRGRTFASAAGGGSEESSERDFGDRPAKPKPGARTYYDILEIGRRAKPDEIKQAYRKLAKKYHPDRNADDPEAETKFKEVQEAYGTLNEPFKRALYDQDLQFSTYGSNVTQEVDREKWTEHWERETPEEREARKERYRRYAAGERNDLPPEPFKLSFAPLYMLGGFAAITVICIKAPDWLDGQSDPTFCDPAHDDTSVPLVRAYHDPVQNQWVRLPEGTDAPTPKELYSFYRQYQPELLERLDFKSLPKVELTTFRVPRTDAIKAKFIPRGQKSQKEAEKAVAQAKIEAEELELRSRG
eukprot:CAMPEP_0206526774 /NCGR_PEP_ID=MMETSP0325_2-20121206/945_1 /ASSEMBLY_ACC=CAM_ASM_000347 /TAXON_ID=2866 /ORGANISM="Crypthecodinium cohnii, Strain Seligo" /LENGTH=351 /DNA_ID=CAMNT_0054022041 /DNA_START=35 /DNA_END=1093 /DNA_ORIENTATION=-